MTGFLGANNQQQFTQLFASLKIRDQFIRVNGDTRINVKIAEKWGQVSELSFPRLSIQESHLIEFEHTLYQLMTNHDVFVIAGSFPKGVSAERCATWIKYLQQAGKKVFFNSSNQALATAVGAQP